mmetsp:Transcript_81738/g.189856  ORF Transcript_81738/g.189856 Transcript_81738/m.189856 type:complete len:234 (-) Transcript_81738:150-851(-)
MASTHPADLHVPLRSVDRSRRAPQREGTRAGAALARRGPHPWAFGAGTRGPGDAHSTLQKIRRRPSLSLRSRARCGQSPFTCVGHCEGRLLGPSSLWRWCGRHCSPPTHCGTGSHCRAIGHGLRHWQTGQRTQECLHRCRLPVCRGGMLVVRRGEQLARARLAPRLRAVARVSAAGGTGHQMVAGKARDEHCRRRAQLLFSSNDQVVGKVGELRHYGNTFAGLAAVHRRDQGT